MNITGIYGNYSLAVRSQSNAYNFCYNYTQIISPDSSNNLSICTGASKAVQNVNIKGISYTELIFFALNNLDSLNAIQYTFYYTPIPNTNNQYKILTNTSTTSDKNNNFNSYTLIKDTSSPPTVWTVTDSSNNVFIQTNVTKSDESNELFFTIQCNNSYLLYIAPIIIAGSDIIHNSSKINIDATNFMGAICFTSAINNILLNS
jgi:hypothetical protein